MSDYKTGGLVRKARELKGMSQEKFGTWLAEQIDRDTPYTQKDVSRWETGVFTPNRNIREVLAPMVAKEAVIQIHHEVEFGLVDEAEKIAVEWMG